MEFEANSKTRNAEIAGKIVALLEPLNSEERRNVIAGSMALLGETFVPGGGAASVAGGVPAYPGGTSEPNNGVLAPRAFQWAKQSGLTLQQLERVFDVTTPGVPVIAAQAPGENSKVRSINAYLLQGLSRFLASGDPTFTDQDARDLCKTFGCYDSSNHSFYLEGKSNLFLGSKKQGWKLTAPGLQHCAELVSELSKE